MELKQIVKFVSSTFWPGLHKNVRLFCGAVRLAIEGPGLFIFSMEEVQDE
jgi:hypothetical protein